MDRKSNNIVIVQPAPADSGAVPAHGTKVLTQDGREIDGITAVTLHAEVGDIWRATIECYPHVSESMVATAIQRNAKPLNWWQRLCIKMSGLRLEVETTSLDRSSRSYRMFP